MANSINSTVSFFNFMTAAIAELSSAGHFRTAETYTSTLRSLKRYTDNKDFLCSEIDHVLVAAYENFLTGKGMKRNSSSFYIRIFRAAYNKAVARGIARPISPHPFSTVYTGVDKTAKRALTIESISKIRNLDLSKSPSLIFARDMFMFSFYTRGMSLVDMAYLKKSDVKDGLISYTRRKTGKRLFIRMEKCMLEIIGKHSTPDSPYLLSIISHPTSDQRKQYLSASHIINRHLKEIGKKADCGMILTMYVARHSWANIARHQHIPISIISEGMGHSSESTTRIYLDSINNSIIDHANHSIIESLYRNTADH